MNLPARVSVHAPQFSRTDTERVNCESGAQGIRENVLQNVSHVGTKILEVHLPVSVSVSVYLTGPTIWLLN